MHVAAGPGGFPTTARPVSAGSYGFANGLAERSSRDPYIHSQHTRCSTAGGKRRAYGGHAIASHGASNPATTSYYGHREQLRDVLDAIEHGRPPAVGGEEARKPLEIILAGYESARRGEITTLPLQVAPAHHI